MFSVTGHIPNYSFRHCAYKDILRMGYLSLHDPRFFLGKTSLIKNVGINDFKMRDLRYVNCASYLSSVTPKHTSLWFYENKLAAFLHTNYEAATATNAWGLYSLHPRFITVRPAERHEKSTIHALVTECIEPYAKFFLEKKKRR